MKVWALLIIFSSAAFARPELGTQRLTSQELKESQTGGPSSVSLPVEARAGSEGPGVRTLEYYGGARGQYLLVYPDGRMYVTGKRRNPTESEEDVGTAPEEPSDTVSIGQPPENASVAEAKPVSVAIAGEGGVASAAPIGQAIVGPGGLAISRPVATAVAGVPGQEQLIAQILGSGKAHGYAYSIYHPNAVSSNAIFYYPSVVY